MPLPRDWRESGGPGPEDEAVVVESHGFSAGCGRRAVAFWQEVPPSNTSRAASLVSQEQQELRTRSDAMSSPLRVLLIEDSADDALLILHELRRGGYEPEWLRVDTALDLRSALQQPDWDVITCDYVMPGFGALEALAVIGEVGCDAPVIIVSGEVGEEVATVALTNGAHDFVSKHHLTRLVPAIGRELRESEERRVRRLAETTALFQAQLLDAAGQAIIAVDPDGFIIYWNRCAESLYGWTTAEVMGRQILDVTLAAPQRAEAAVIMAQLQRGESWSGEQQVQRRDGSLFTAEVHNSPVLDANGALIAIIGVSTDITERKRVEAALTLSERSYRALVETSHDLVWAVDLEGIITFVNDATRVLYGYEPEELIGRKFDILIPAQALPAEMETFARNLSTARFDRNHETPVQHLDGTVRMLHVNTIALRDEQGRVVGLMGTSTDISARKQAEEEIRRLNADLSAHAAEIAAELRRADPNRTVEFTLAAGLVVEGDERLLRVALENLLGNAWKYTGKHERARIELGTLSDNEQRVYFVRDDGAGFDPAFAERLFGAFQRMHAASDFEGTGIGLATVQRIIHRHGGRIWAEGAVERGATFYFTLPWPEVV
jgi:PAS domain S-box-containing protein